MIELREKNDFLFPFFEEKNKFLGLNRPFIEVAHFEYTMTIGAQLLQDSKNISKYSKMINFD